MRVYCEKFEIHLRGMITRDWQGTIVEFPCIGIVRDSWKGMMKDL